MPACDVSTRQLALNSSVNTLISPIARWKEKSSLWCKVERVMQTAVRLSEGGAVRLLMTALQEAECLLMTTFLQTEHPPDDYITRVEPMFLLIPLLLEVRCRLRNISLVIAGNLYLKDLNTETQPCVWAVIRQAGALVEATAVRLHVYLNGSTAVCSTVLYIYMYI